ncbi:hypothetical protein FIV31_07050 [Coxiella endosymbiont of Ornithodoros amblus]|uniref:ABC-type transport auxiliary lipoprotein family protein n=1 Tax=Coxiella endosymbiont of Ornithodoros amblus TaxID=1656166 RepID=UPI00244E1C9C|nr:ABC-type transport auxiliary lipoprotein family protein [Coxiella endosymbiont of Ornithodoros amblus]MBW5803022.1 hypothetical protein [Coxiella endosymbiont of Ornithodoros amblus]
MKIIKFILIIFFSINLVDCGPVVLPPISYYQLDDLKLVRLPPHSKTHLTILVSMPIPNPGYQTSAIIYMLTPYELSRYANSRWVAPPSEMLMPLLVQALRQTGYFYAVVSPSFFGMTHYRLDTRLLKLQQEFFFPISRIRLTMEASLIRSATNHVVANHLFEVLVAAPMNNPYGCVLAANKAAAIMSYRIAQFCTAYTH